MLVRVMGPMFGIGLAATCLKHYVVPNDPPDFGEDDPRWVGAWWMGTPILGGITTVLALLIMIFPRRLPIYDSSYRNELIFRQSIKNRSRSLGFW